MTKNYELVFSGSAGSTNFPRYKRNHASLESAREEVRKVRDGIEEGRHHNTALDGPARYNPIVYVSDGREYGISWYGDNEATEVK
jgi:hypothetical protein